MRPRLSFDGSPESPDFLGLDGFGGGFLHIKREVKSPCASHIQFQKEYLGYMALVWSRVRIELTPTKVVSNILRQHQQKVVIRMLSHCDEPPPLGCH